MRVCVCGVTVGAAASARVGHRQTGSPLAQFRSAVEHTHARARIYARTYLHIVYIKYLLTKRTEKQTTTRGERGGTRKNENYAQLTCVAATTSGCPCCLCLCCWCPVRLLLPPPPSIKLIGAHRRLTLRAR